MKKTALLLIFMLLLSNLYLGGVLVSADTYKEYFDISSTIATTIDGDNYTRFGASGQSSSYFINGYYYCPNYTTNTNIYFAEWDLNVLEAGTYKISIKAGGNVDAADTVIGLFRSPFNADLISTTSKKATEVISKTVVPSSGNPYATLLFDLGTIDLPAGITSIGLRNYGSVRFIHEIIITPVENSHKIVRTPSDYSSRNLSTEYIYTDSTDDEKYNLVNTNSSINYKINVIESGYYLMYLNYGNYHSATYVPTVTVSLGQTEDSLSTYNTYKLPVKTRTKGASAELINIPVGVISLEEGEQYIQLKSYADPYFGKIVLEKVDEHSEPATLLSSINIDYLTIPSNIGTKYCNTGQNNEVQARNMEETYNITAATAGKYDIYMNIATPASYGYKITLSVDGVKQSYKAADSVENGGWSNYNYVNVGSVILPKGTSEIKIHSLASSYTDNGSIRFFGYFIFKDFKFVKSGEEVLAKTYSDTEPTFTTTSLNKAIIANVESAENTDNVVRLTKGNTVTYPINLNEGGLYSLKIAVSSKTQNSKMTIITDNSEKTSSFAFSLCRGYEYVDLGYFNFKKGINEITISLDSGITCDLLALYFEKPEFSIYSGSSSNVPISSIIVPEGGLSNKTYTAKIAFNNVLVGEDAKCVFAIYEDCGDGVKYLAYSKSVLVENVTGNETKDITLTGVNLEEGKTYSAKVFLWDAETLIGSCEEF